jgi:uncharacterized protein YndB with AHSA1/START domain
MTNTSRTLSITRHFNAPRAAVWRCWSEGDLLKQWYSPKPWTVSVADIDVRAGGKSQIVMNGPNGEVNPIHGQYLEVVDGVSQTFSDAFVGDWMPGAAAPFMVGYVILSDAPDGGTNMEWGARHWSDEAFEQHKAMGFEFGWNAAADQLDALVASL